MVIRGKVVKGKSLGRKLGFPTANIAVDDELEVDNGVYRSVVLIDGEKYLAISNIGVKPTVGGENRALESHILDFSRDVYGKTIEVELLEKLRDEQHFDSVELLKAQVDSDIERVKKLNNNK